MTEKDIFLKQLEELDEKEEKEWEEIEKIIKSGKKKKINHNEYIKNYAASIGECGYCMNYDCENDTCKKNMPFINPWYGKENDTFEECQEWEYIYEEEG